MGFLPRLFVLIGLSFVFTLLLMVVFWEPEGPLGAAAASSAAPHVAASGLISGIQ